MAHDQSEDPRRPGASTAEAEPAAILLVDDNEANLVALRAGLAGIDARLVCARSGEEALRYVLREDFAVILLDVLMPGMNGYETATLIRSRAKSQHIPIIFLSAVNKDQAHLFEGYSAGAVDYVFKPVEPFILSSKVSVFIELHKKAEAIRQKAELEKQLLRENLEVRMEQMRTSKALERSRAQQTLMIEMLPIALHVSPCKDGFRSRRFVAGSLEKLCGFPARRLSRPPTAWLTRVHEDDREAVLAALACVEKAGSYSAEYRWKCADGTFRWFSDYGILPEPDGGSSPEMYGFWLDVSERRLLEQKLTHAQKIDSIGQLTGGIAHDFNNMLSVILASLANLEPAVAGDAKASRRVDLALQAANSCADLTRQLLSFARRQALEPRSISIDKEVQRLKGLLDHMLGSGIGIEVEAEPELWPAHLDAAQFEATLVNLAINARDAMPDGGTLRFALRNVTVDDPLRSGLDLKPGDYVELVVADTGTGMSEDVLQKVFEPFFTTKETDKGTGLGLSTIHGFLKQSGGTVTIDSALGRGTNVHLYLPRAAGGEAGAEARPGPSDARGLDGCKVLVVEDDEKVREIALSMLRDLGCVTSAAGDGRQALACIDDGEEFEIVFTDCVMPGGLDGPALAREVVRRRPDLPVLFTSGYSKTLDQEATSGIRSAFLAKPYSAAQLQQAISALLHDPG